MRKFLLAGVAVIALAGSTAVFAHHRPWMHHHVRMNPEDRAAFLDARIASVKAGLKLTPDQEKLWPTVEGAVRDFAKLRMDRANARMQQRDNARDNDAQGPETPDNPVARLQRRADDMATTAAALKKIADAADPLYKTLDEGQKRRLAMLTRMGGHSGGGEGWHHRGPRFERDNFEGPGLGPQDFGHRGPDGDNDRAGPERGSDRNPGPERL
jgi:hypothetical protein